MTEILTVIGVVVAVLWFISGLLNRRQHELYEETQAFYDAIEKNREADDQLTDAEFFKRLRDKYND